ncbi:MAG TPA: T9SS type A sorting domain-containing protein [Chitinophagales bacterium]|nr:T9SS type A sorting domain-containing protein [Chitinophagales bacterium]
MLCYISVITFCSAQNFVNGSFELNTGFCIINAYNAYITSNVTGLDAYGCGNEMDLMNNTCGYGTAYAGDYFLCLANSSGICPDACTLQLDAPLVSGNSYTISYYDRGWDQYGCCPPGVPLEIGVSDIAGAAGTIVYTSPVPTTNSWSHRVFTFVAPNSGQYISIAAQDNTTRWTHIDSIGFQGCSASLFIVPSAPSICAGDSVTVSATGTDTYLWNPASGLNSTTDSVVIASPDSTTTYTLIGNSNAGCADTITVTVTVNATPSVTIMQSNDTLFSSFGNSYQWYTGGNAISGATDSIYVPASEGFYTVVITNTSGCMAADTIYFSLSPQTGFAASDTAICQKFCMDFFDQTGNNPTSWQWSFPGGSPSSSALQNPTQICYNSAGAYDVTLITTNAYGTDTLILADYITVYSTPPFPTITVNGYVLTSSYAGSYQWQFNSVDIPGATNQSYTVTQTGYYTVRISDENGCVNSAMVYVQIVGVNELADPGIFIYPNPSEGKFVIEFSNISFNQISIDMVNALGQKVYSDYMTNTFGTAIKKEIDVSNLSNGIYSIGITEGSNVVRRKIVIMR